MTEQPYDAVAKRWGFQIPESYRLMRAAGLFELRGPRELWLTDLEWLAVDEIAKFEPLSFQIGGLVPFAKSARVDLWCWHAAWSGAIDNPVVFCPRDLNTATVYAPDFAGAIHRLLLEEFSGSWLVDDLGVDGAQARCRSYVELLRGFLPEAWLGRLQAVASASFRELQPGVFGFLPRVEAEALIAHDLVCPELNSEFQHYRPVA